MIIQKPLAKREPILGCHRLLSMLLSSTAKAFGTSRHLTTDLAFLERVVMFVKVSILRALQVSLADEHVLIYP